jgi:hypothetical protein
MASQKRSLALDIRLAGIDFPSDVGRALEFYVNGKLLFRGDRAGFERLWAALPNIHAAFGGMESEGVRPFRTGTVRFQPGRNPQVGYVYTLEDVAACMLFRHEVEEALDGRGAFLPDDVLEDTHSCAGWGCVCHSES